MWQLILQVKLLDLRPMPLKMEGCYGVALKTLFQPALSETQSEYFEITAYISISLAPLNIKVLSGRNVPSGPCLHQAWQVTEALCTRPHFSTVLEALSVPELPQELALLLPICNQGNWGSQRL